MNVPRTGMPALTFWRPWAESLVTGIKRLEYRHHAPPKTIVGVELCVVAGAQFDPRAIEWIRVNCGVDWSERPKVTFQTGIIGVVTVTGWREDYGNPDFGTFAWTLANPVRIERVPCQSAHGQGVRYVAGEALKMVRERVARARERLAGREATR